MNGDRVILDCTAAQWHDAFPDPGDALGKDFTYIRLTIRQGRLQDSEAAACLVRQAFIALYGECDCGEISAARLCHHAWQLVKTNRYHHGSVAARLYLFPRESADARPGPLTLMAITDQLLYPGYTLWHKPLRAMALQYEYPFSGILTGTSLSAHKYAGGYVRRMGYDVPLSYNYQGVVTGAGEYPLFAVYSSRVITTGFECGVAESLERQRVLHACDMEGIPLHEEPLVLSALSGCDELFIATEQGLTSIGEFDGRTMPGSMAARVVAAMEQCAR